MPTPPKTVKIGQFSYFFRNWFEFCYLYMEIFVFKEYAFQSRSDQPVIVDCGAHIGLGIIFFKQCYPQAEILAFEPDPNNLKLLENTLIHNHITRVKIIPHALGSKNGQTQFYLSAPGKPSWGNSIIANAENSIGKPILVKVDKLSTHLPPHVDFLKMDIEGMEVEVLEEIRSKLPQIEQLIIEVHDTPHTHRHKVRSVEKTLMDAGFAVHTSKPLRIAIGETIDALLGRRTSDIYMISAKQERSAIRA